MNDLRIRSHSQIMAISQTSVHQLSSNNGSMALARGKYKDFPQSESVTWDNVPCNWLGIMILWGTANYFDLADVERLFKLKA